MTISRYLGAKIRNNIEIIHNIAHFYTLFNRKVQIGHIYPNKRTNTLTHSHLEFVNGGG